MAEVEKWAPVLWPQERDLEKPENQGGVVVMVSNGEINQEVSRVNYIRRNSKNPKVSFEKQIQREISRARTVCELLNTYPERETQ